MRTHLLSLLTGVICAGLYVGAASAQAPAADPQASAACTYRTSSWHVKKKRTVDRRRVEKTRGELTAEERDPDDPRCTVCSEDQTTLALPGLPEVTVCVHYADQVKQALTEAKAAGFEIKSLVGYRVGRTRGKVVDDRRTQFSNHSYGTAIDINAKNNGLYARCTTKSPTKAEELRRCKLRVGGAWDPAKRPRRTVIEGGPAHKAFSAFWKWGGAIDGSIKDFMHFSITGR